MGSENLHHKRKAKQIKTRKTSQLEPLDYVLIVCEGSKTEPNYFNELISYYKIPSANVKIDGTCGSDPVSVVNYAKTLFEQEIKYYGRNFDKVYCVFDQDQYHLKINGKKYQKALSIISAVIPTNTFFAIHSVPCFEYWILLHHAYTTKPFCGILGQQSSGEAVIEMLKTYWPDYNKGDHNIFLRALNIDNDEMETVKNRAKKCNLAAKKAATDNPTTLVNELISYLQNLKDKKIN